jgi:hypothetical protein
MAAWLLEEWAAWARGDRFFDMGWYDATPFGRLIKPDPQPAKMPVDPERALKTDRVVVKLPGWRRYWIKLHFLDPGPIDAKARRCGRNRDAYLNEINTLIVYVGRRLDEPHET